MNRLKTGDKVVVITGDDKGKEGKILKILKDRVIVEGVNIVKKHLKPKNNNGNGEIIETEASIHASNVKVIDAKKEPKKTAKKDEKTKETKVSKKATKKVD